MITTAQFKNYCDQHNLFFSPRVPTEDDDNVVAIGFLHDPDVNGAPVALLTTDGEVQVAVEFADGYRRMEDTWIDVDEAEFKSGQRLHAV